MPIPKSKHQQFRSIQFIFVISIRSFVCIEHFAIRLSRKKIQSKNAHFFDWVQSEEIMFSPLLFFLMLRRLSCSSVIYMPQFRRFLRAFSFSLSPALKRSALRVEAAEKRRTWINCVRNKKDNSINTHTHGDEVALHFSWSSDTVSIGLYSDVRFRRFFFTFFFGSFGRYFRNTFE